MHTRPPLMGVGADTGVYITRLTSLRCLIQDTVQARKCTSIAASSSDVNANTVPAVENP